MDKYQAAVKTRYLGNTQPAFAIATRPDPGDLESPDALEREQLIRQRSIENYTPMSKDEVMGWLNQRYAPRIYTTPDTSGDGLVCPDRRRRIGECTDGCRNGAETC